MLAWLFHVAKKRPNFLVAASRRIWQAYGLGGGEEFILEGDEYDSAYWDKAAKFFHYHPDDLIITSLEFDHADIYADFDTYQLAFRRLVNLVPRRGRVIAWGDPEAGEALGTPPQRLSARSFATAFIDNGWVAANVQSDGDAMTFQ